MITAKSSTKDFSVFEGEIHKQLDNVGIKKIYIFSNSQAFDSFNQVIVLKEVYVVERNLFESFLENLYATSKISQKKDLQNCRLSFVKLIRTFL